MTSRVLVGFGEDKVKSDPSDEDYYSHVKFEHLREFLENNRLGTVFDLEEERTEFQYFYLKLSEQEIIILEVDTLLPNSNLKWIYDLYNIQELTIKEVCEKLKSWPCRARATSKKYGAMNQAAI